MRVAVTGANGQLGSDLVVLFAEAGEHVIPLIHADMELSDIDDVSGTMREVRPDVIVNTAAMHHVEKCESEPARAFAVNVVGARNLALAAADRDAVLMHISTDYVFDGAKREPYVEEDLPLPLNLYGNTKLAGEHCIRSVWKKHFILRTSAIYGTSPCRAKNGLNFVELMLKLARERGEVRVVDSEFVTPTSTREIARQAVRLSRSDAYGLYHATAEGNCSWYEFAREIFALTGTRVNLKKADQSEFVAKVPRPAYSVLENRALKRLGLNSFGPWQTGLSDYLNRRVS